MNSTIYAEDIASVSDTEILTEINIVEEMAEPQTEQIEIVEATESEIIISKLEIESESIEVATESEPEEPEEVSTKSEIKETTELSTKSKRAQEIEAKMKRDLELGITATTKANDWFKSKSGDWYYLDKQKNTPGGWVVDKYNRWFYFSRDNGKMAKGWTTVDGEKYYFSNTGKDPITEPEENKKVLGQMYSNEKTPDGKMVEEEGSLIIEETDD